MGWPSMEPKSERLLRVLPSLVLVGPKTTKLKMVMPAMITHNQL